MVALKYALSFVALFVTAAKAATFQPQNMLIMNGLPNGIYAYAFANGSLVELRSPATTANASAANTWLLNRDAATMASLGVVNVSPATTIAGYGYLTVQSSLSALAQRLFYQTTNGNIMSAYHSGLTGSAGWVVDTTIATGIPLGAPITAVIAVQQNTRQQVAIVQYTDASGLLNSRFSVLDQGGWSAPIVVTT
ncbi:hypothetical protein R3P38DRAFT_3451638 [Favolaschia claudopus]|uniref:Fucose-specific lectin n=1 Tax=Favolaschia claudopus TaxID=2862362 RepID=A0AAV9ZKP0_9AGAR